jgi:hypothetical protein
VCGTGLAVERKDAEKSKGDQFKGLSLTCLLNWLNTHLIGPFTFCVKLDMEKLGTEMKCEDIQTMLTCVYYLQE